jgi:RNA polymerase sigma-70 factor, ECF subfamily
VSATSGSAPGSTDLGDVLLGIYDEALLDVYGYLHRRCRNRAVAEDLTTEVFLAAVESIHRQVVDTVTIAWLIGIARHKLVDHWRRTERDQRKIDAVGAQPATGVEEWVVRLDALTTRDVLADLAAHHRIALTLRYVDDLPVRDVAQIIDRTVHATEALLVRARRAFRARYEEVTT